ncbi:vacuolar protein sorting-associated protein 8 [Histomonas meleagridis]|uniref:vacuolar protein sorting-associated protein 8-like n=1 Tax=Histomonas meleagridis TaxID=135588 RepID=UPI00355A9BBE|nr:vacuolar protein sorting-associated protein 8 [Histomonas meleagridis]KAH0797279.1 vacuolar protein sorting-associated protein 8-like [Histomonas meleagridis]
MGEDSVLSQKEIKGIQFAAPPVMSVSSDDYFLFLYSDGSIHTFDSNSLKTSTLPPHSKSVSASSVTTIAVNPPHTLAAIGLDDGTLLFYDLVDSKMLKKMAKAAKGAVMYSLFLGDFTYLCYDISGNVTVYKISISKLGASISFLGSAITIKESISITIDQHIYQISAPMIFHSICIPQKITQNSKCDSEAFSNIVGISTENSFLLTNFSTEFKVITEQQISNSLIAFSPVVEDVIYYALANESQLIIYSLDSTNFQSTELYSQDSSKRPVFLTFISPFILSIIYEDNSCLLLWFKEFYKVETTIPFQGTFLHGVSNFRIITNDKIWKFSLFSFAEKIEIFQETHNHHGAIEFCKKAKNNELHGIVGLPQNPSQKSLFIERQISVILEQMLNEEIKTSDKNKISESIDFLIQLSKDLSMSDWITSNAIRYFKSSEYLKIFFEHIIKGDPDAQFFHYTKNFVDLLIETYPDPSIRDFLLKLPSKAAPTTSLLKYCLSSKDLNLLKNVYIERLNDPLTCVKIFANSKDYETVSDIILDVISNDFNTNNKANSLIEWLFSFSDEFRFTHFRNLMELNHNQTIQVVFNYVERNQQPMTSKQFINDYIYILNLKQTPTNDRLYKLMENFILESQPILIDLSLKYVLPKIFSNEYTEPDQRDEVLLVILKTSLTPTLQSKLIPFCEEYNFSKSRNYLYENSNNYERITRSYLLYGNDDPFSYIINVLQQNNEQSKEGIKKALLTNAVLLITKDIHQYLNIILKYFPNDFHNDLIKTLKDETILNYYIKSLFETCPNPSINYNDLDLKNYLEYLCKYFPDEVYSFLISLRDIDVEYLKLCKKYCIFDACTYLSYRVGDVDESYHYLYEYFETKLMDFVEDKINDINPLILFINDFLTKFKILDYETITLSIIKSFILPLYDCKNKEKVSILSETLRKICSIAIDYVPFNLILKTIIIEFAPFNVDTIRSSLCGIINDFNYDIDTTKSLANLFRNDERKSQEKYILQSISGTKFYDGKCGTCHRSLTSGSSLVNIFSCGHAFHANKDCLPKQMCPICNPEIKLDHEVTPPSATIGQMEVMRKLRKFEFCLNSKNIVNNTMQKKGNIAISGNMSLI